MEKENYHLWREEASQNAFTLADIAIHAMYALTTGNFYSSYIKIFEIFVFVAWKTRYNEFEIVLRLYESHNFAPCHLCVCMGTFYNNDEERQKFAFSSDWSPNLPFRILISSQMGFNWIFINFSRSSKETFQQDSKFKWFLLWSPPSVPHFFAL